MSDAVREVERAILAILLNSNAMSKIAALLRAEDFVSVEHGLVYGAIFELYGEGAPATLVTVADKLRGSGTLEAAGGINLLAELQQMNVATASLEYLTKSVLENAETRHLAHLAENVLRATKDPGQSASSIRGTLESELSKTTMRYRPNRSTTIADLLPSVLEEYRTGVERGTPTCYPSLDRLLRGGFKPGQLITVAAAPGLGKTSFVVSILLNIGRSLRIPSLIFSLEMSGHELTNKLLGMVAELQNELDPETWRYSPADTARALEAAPVVSALPIDVHADFSVTIAGVRAEVDRKVQETQGRLGLVVVDYLQLITPLRSNSNANRTTEVSEITRGLKAIATEFKVPLVAVSQLNRETLKRVGHRPELADLRESGSIEQDSDVVIFVHRDSYYLEAEERRLAEMNATPAEIIVRKNRNGTTGTAILNFIARTTLFTLNEDTSDSRFMAPDADGDGAILLDGDIGAEEFEV